MARDDIAIVGTACRLSGEVSSLGTLWEMISHAKSGHCKIPLNRWDADRWYHPDPDRKGAISVKHGYFLKQDVGNFDAPFFSTTAKEAAAMDPMKRLLLEVAYESVENAGIPVETLMNSQTGCYVGCMTNDYEMISLHDIYDLGHTAASAISEAMTANRVSWFFGLQGPSLTLDTACSSSLYALHLACQSLKLGETNMSLVAGVNLILNPNMMHQLSAMHMLSPEGISHTFDDRANGYGRGEGIGCMVVKRLSDALRDGDTIRAVIRGTSVNADGKTPSITQPSSTAQADLIRKTYEAAGLLETETQYFESHGTGTPVGDPIELEAIGTTIGASRAAVGLGPLYVGSIKANVGHTEGCSGLAGVFKAITLLEQGMLAPTYGIENVNPKLKLDEWHLAFPQLIKWPGRGQRRISVNSFGFGGANAHAILDDAHYYLAQRKLVGNHNTVVHDDDDSESGISVGSSTPVADDDDIQRLFVFSTKDQAGVQRMAELYGDALAKPDSGRTDPRFLGNLAYTLAARRSTFDFRSYVVASTLTELSAQLTKGLPKLARAARHGLVFVFTGQGAQWPGMARQLVRFAKFKESIQISQQYLYDLGCKWDAIEELEKIEESNIGLPSYSQTLCTVLQIALVELLRTWNITPKATVGHSSGEIAAAYAAELLTQADAIKLAFIRGICSTDVTREGAMLAAGLSEDEAQKYLAHVTEGAVVVACVNSPVSVTLSGDVDAITILEALISADGKFTRRLQVKQAYHSPHMDEVSKEYSTRIGELSHPTHVSNKTLMFSSLSGQVVLSPQELDAQYWVSNMQSPVQFSAAVSALLQHPAQAGKNAPVQWGAFVELGPHAALKGPVQQIITSNSNTAAKDAPYVGVVLRNRDAVTTALEAAGRLWAAGHPVNLESVNNNESDVCIAGPKALTDLPPYPWNHGKRYWHESHLMESNRFPQATRNDLLGVPVDMQNASEPQWRNQLRISENPWIEQHKITNTILYPGAGMLVMALEAALQTISQPTARASLSGFRFRDVTFDRGLVVTTGDKAAVETRLSMVPHPTMSGLFHFTLYSTTSGSSWTKHCYGTIALEHGTGSNDVEEATTMGVEWARYTTLFDRIQKDSTGEVVEVDAFYEHLRNVGMQYGQLFRNVVELHSVPGVHAAYGNVVIPDTLSSMPAAFEFPHVMHPATMDAICHLALAAFNDGRPIEEATVPYHIGEMFVSAHQPQGAGEIFRGYGKLVHRTPSGHELVGDVVLSNETWSGPKLIIRGFALRQVTSGQSTGDVARGLGNEVHKCARVLWKRDISFIKSSADLAGLHDTYGVFSAWFDCLMHKKAVDKILVLFDDAQVPSFANKALLAIGARTGCRPGFGHIDVAAPSSSITDAVRLLLGPEVGVREWNWSLADEKSKVVTGNFDAILLIRGDQQVDSLEKGELLVHLRDLISPFGHLVILQDTDYQDHGDTQRKLQAAGFADPFAHAGTVIASVASSAPATVPSELYLLVPTDPTPDDLSLAAALTTTFSSRTNVHRITLSEASQVPGKHILSLLESSMPFVYSWTADDFEAFRAIVSAAEHVFWLTKGDVLNAWGPDVAGTAFAPTQGLLRVMRNEYPLVRMPHLDISRRLDITRESTAELISRVWRTTLVSGTENEFAETGGAVYIPRAVGDGIYDEELQLASGSGEPVKTLLRQVKQPLIPKEMAGSALVWVEDDAANKFLGPREVEIEISYVALDTSNPDAEVSALGRTAVGVITRRGMEVTSVSKGQQVAVMSFQGALRTHVRQDEALVAVLPQDTLPEEVAVMSGLFIAAQYALLEVARLQKGQTLLIHTAASPRGQAAVQISAMIGANVIALVSSREEKQLLVHKYAIAPEQIYDSASRSFVAHATQITGNCGVDVIFSSQKSLAVLPSLDVLGDFGHFVDLSQDSQQIDLPLSKRNASITRIDMDRVYSAKPELVTSLFKHTFQLFASGSIAPITPVSTMSITKISEALSLVKDSKHLDSTVVLSLIDPDATVLTPAEPAPHVVLDPKGTYILVGGLGALGVDVARMMAVQGAGHLVFLSRSGGSSKHISALETLRALGTRAEAYSCDVTDKDNVAKIFAVLQQQQCQVRGVIQAAMVLEDSIFENMTHEKWLRAFLPKTRGSRNLLDQLVSLSLPADNSSLKPFFILLSSITGIIGNTAQANYAAGNTFEDALAHYAQKHLGLPATSIDVGLVSDSSHFTDSGEFGNLEGYLHRYSHGWKGLQTSLAEVRTIISALMRRSHSGQPVPAQLVLGLGDSLVRKADGHGFEHDAKFELRISRDQDNVLGEEDGAKGLSMSEQLAAASSHAMAAAVVEDDLKAQVAAAIGVAVTEIDGSRPLFDFGVDSLKAVEIRNRSQRELQSDVSVFELLSSTPLTELAAKIASKSKLVRVDCKSDV